MEYQKYCRIWEKITRKASITPIWKSLPEQWAKPKKRPENAFQDVLIVVDVTGGMATSSAAGGALTLEAQERIQYAHTETANSACK